MDAAYAFLLLSLVLERLFDPLIVLPAALAGLLLRRWPYVVAAAVAIGGTAEMLRYVSNFQPAALAVACFAALAWGTLCHALRSWLGRRRAVSAKAPSP